MHPLSNNCHKKQNSSKNKDLDNLTDTEKKTQNTKKKKKKKKQKNKGSGNAWKLPRQTDTPVNLIYKIA
jgi:hypothetical protein